MERSTIFNGKIHYFYSDYMIYYMIDDDDDDDDDDLL